jgi:hypothetical protein
LEIDGGELLLYNGNRFGRSGFGLAWRQPVPPPQERP